MSSYPWCDSMTGLDVSLNMEVTKLFICLVFQTDTKNMGETKTWRRERTLGFF